MTTTPFVHNNAKASEQELEAEAAEAYGSSPVRQAMAELYEQARTLKLAWRTPEHALALYPVPDRFKDMRSNPFARAAYLKSLINGLPPKMALRMDPDAQSALVLEGMREDFSAEFVEENFNARSLALYADLSVRYFQIGDALLWAENSPAHKSLFKTLFRSALNADREWNGKKLPPITTAHGLLSSIDDDHWEEHVSREKRAKIRRSTLDLEKLDPNKPHTAAMVLEIVTIDGLDDLPVECLRKPFKFIGKMMGFVRADVNEEPAETGSPRISEVNTKEKDASDEADWVDEPPAVLAASGDVSPKADAAPPPVQTGTTGAATATSATDNAPTAEAKKPEDEERPTYRPLPPEGDGPNSPETPALVTPAAPAALTAHVQGNDGKEEDVVVLEVTDDTPDSKQPEVSRREASSPNILADVEKELELIEKLQKELKEKTGLDFSKQRLDERDLYRVKKLVIDGKWLPQEADSKQAMLHVMKALDPALDIKATQQFGIAPLKNSFYTELRKNPKLVPIAERLAGSIKMTVPASALQKGTKPPPLPGTGTGGSNK